MKPFVWLVFALFLYGSTICAGQDRDEYGRETWLMSSGIYQEPFYLRLDRYSVNDVAEFREKLGLLQKENKSSDWGGIWGSDTEILGYSRLQWSPQIGYVSFYLYTCMPELRSVDYGIVSETNDTVLFTPQLSPNTPRMAQPQKFVKIVWGERRYLVADPALLAFAEKAVGIHVDNENVDKTSGEWYNYWVSGDLEKELTGLPEFPSAYHRFRRSPIFTTILSVSRRRIVDDYETGNTVHTAPAYLYSVVMQGGANTGIKPGMRLYIDELGDEIYVEKVTATRATGVILRHLDENGEESCVDDESGKIACAEILPKFKARTRVGYMWY